MTIYKVDNTYVVSSHRVWIPGCYESERAAKYAVRFPDSELQKIQDSVNPNGVITFLMLQELRKKIARSKVNRAQTEEPGDE